MTEARSHWDDMYLSQSPAPWETSETPVELANLARRLPDHSFVLDLGCGSTRHATAFAELGHNVVAVDFSIEALTLGRHNARHRAGYGHVFSVAANVLDLPVATRPTFDAAY